MNCPQCNKEFPDDKIPRFCTGCGCKLNDSAAGVKKASNEVQKKTQIPRLRQSNDSGGKTIMAASVCLLGTAVIIAGIYFYDKSSYRMSVGTDNVSMSSDHVISDNNNTSSGGAKEEATVEVRTEVVYITEVVTQVVTEKLPEITTAAPVSTPTSSEYILPDSSTRYISVSELTGLSTYQLRLARNEIYARHGRLFNDAGLRSYFNSCSWYHGSISPNSFDANANSYFNSYEKENIKVIQSVENSKK